MTRVADDLTQYFDVFITYLRIISVGRWRLRIQIMTVWNRRRVRPFQVWSTLPLFTEVHFCSYIPFSDLYKHQSWITENQCVVDDKYLRIPKVVKKEWCTDDPRRFGWNLFVLMGTLINNQRNYKFLVCMKLTQITIATNLSSLEILRRWISIVLSCTFWHPNIRVSHLIRKFSLMTVWTNTDWKFFSRNISQLLL